MRVVSLLGSPHAKGNTAAVLDLVEAWLTEGGAEVERIHLERLSISTCWGCWACAQTPDAPGCSQSDDMGRVFEAMFAADGIIFASPLYCWTFSAQMKTVLDRCVALVKTDSTGKRTSLVAGKKSALVVTAAGGYEGNADLIGPVFHRFSKYSDMTALPEMIITGCTSPEAMPPETSGRAGKLAAMLLR